MRFDPPIGKPDHVSPDHIAALVAYQGLCPIGVEIHCDRTVSTRTRMSPVAVFEIPLTCRWSS